MCKASSFRLSSIVSKDVTGREKKNKILLSSYMFASYLNFVMDSSHNEEKIIKKGLLSWGETASSSAILPKPKRTRFIYLKRLDTVRDNG